MTAVRRLPRRRPDLVVRALGERGRYVVKDPRTGAYFQLGPHEHFLLDRLDGEQTATTVCRAFEQEFGEPLSDADLGEFLSLAEAQQFLAPQAHAQPIIEPDGGRPDVISDGPAPASTAPAPTPVPAPIPAPPPAGPAQSLLFWRKSLFDPDRLFIALVPWLGFLWTPGFVLVSLTLVAAAGGVVASNWTDLLAGFTGALRWQTAVLVWLMLLAATTLHEFAHGLTLKQYGGEVRELGVLLLFFMPCLFCNVSDAWLLPKRWQRLLVTLAGGYCDLCLWAAAVFVWRLTPPDGLANYLAFVAITVLGARVLFNFNPFLKLDGYYLLADGLDVPNLLERGQERAKAQLRRVLWGAPPPPADPHARVLTVYGLASWLYGIAFLSAAVFGLTRYLLGWLGPAGVAAAVGLTVVLVKGQLKGLAENDLKAMLTAKRARTAVWLLLLAAAGGLLTVPVSDRAGGPFRVRSAGRFELRAPTAGVLRGLSFDEGEVVPAGAVVARLEVPDLASRQARKRAEAAEAKAKLDLLLAGPSPAKAAELTARAERADRWHALARADLDRERAVHHQETTRLNALVARWQAELKQATAALDRQQSLRSQGAVSAEEYDGAAARVAICRGELDQATAERQVVRTKGTALAETELARRAKELADAVGERAVLTAGPRAEEIAAARAAVGRADEEVRYLDELGGKLTVRADRGGVVTTARPRERVGRLFQEGELIAEIEDTSGLEVEVLLREGQAARVVPGQRVEVLARAFPFRAMSGTVVRVASAARRPGDRPEAPQTAASSTPTVGTDSEGLMAVTCVLDDPPPELRPGMTGHARIARGERAGGLVLSESMVRTVRIEFWR